MLIGTNTDMTYKEIRYGLGDISVGDYQPIYDKDQVCKYVVKYFGKDVDYDLLFKNDCLLGPAPPQRQGAWAISKNQKLQKAFPQLLEVGFKEVVLC